MFPQALITKLPVGVKSLKLYYNQVDETKLLPDGLYSQEKSCNLFGAS